MNVDHIIRRLAWLANFGVGQKYSVFLMSLRENTRYPGALGCYVPTPSNSTWHMVSASQKRF